MKKIIGAIVINVDITETEKKQKMHYKKSNEQYSQLFNQMLSGLIVYDVIYDASGNPYDYRMVQANPAFERLTGLSAKQQVGRTSKDLVTKWSEDMRQKLYEVAMTGEPFQYERFNPELGKIIETPGILSPKRAVRTYF
ncbi:MAG: PAS domain S-box protein [Ferruginibacter sp.]